MSSLTVAWFVCPSVRRDDILEDGIRPSSVLGGDDIWLWSDEVEAKTEAADASFDEADVWRVDLAAVEFEHIEHIHDGADVVISGGVAADRVALVPRPTGGWTVGPPPAPRTLSLGDGVGSPSDFVGALARLRTLVPTPVTPAPADATVRPLGIELPRGYRELVHLYGPGTFGDADSGDAIHLYAPGASRNFDVAAQTEQWTGAIRVRLEGSAEARRWSYALSPESGGLLPWGHYGERATLWWKTDGDPGGWPTVAQDWESLSTVEICAPAEQVLLAWITGALDLGWLTPPSAEVASTFTPAGAGPPLGSQSEPAAPSGANASLAGSAGARPTRGKPPPRRPVASRLPAAGWGWPHRNTTQYGADSSPARKTSPLHR